MDMDKLKYSKDSVLLKLDEVRKQNDVKSSSVKTAATQTQTLLVNSSKGVRGDLVEILKDTIYKYTNISFSDANRKDEDALYDMLETNGVIDAVVQASPDDYSYLFEKCEEYLEKYEKFQNSFYGMATKIVNSVPENMAEAMNMLDNLDLEKIAKTMKVAQLNAGNENALEVLVNGQNK